MIGIELSVDRLWAMRKLVFGLGGAQVVVTGIAVIAGIASLFDNTLPDRDHSGRRLRAVVDGDRHAIARREPAARDGDRPRQLLHPPVSGPGGVADPLPDQRFRGRRDGELDRAVAFALGDRPGLDRRRRDPRGWAARDPAAVPLRRQRRQSRDVPGVRAAGHHRDRARHPARSACRWRSAPSSPGSCWRKPSTGTPSRSTSSRSRVCCSACSSSRSAMSIDVVRGREQPVLADRVGRSVSTWSRRRSSLRSSGCSARPRSVALESGLLLGQGGENSRSSWSWACHSPSA